MRKFLLSGNRDAGLLLLRAGAGALMFFSHGLGKVLKFDEMFHTFPDPIGIGAEASYVLNVVAEFVCPLLLIFGLFTRLTVTPIIINMMVIIFAVHLHDPWMRKELPVLMLIAYLTVFISGPGRFSLDALLFRSKTVAELKTFKRERMVVARVT